VAAAAEAKFCGSVVASGAAAVLVATVAPELALMDPLPSPALAILVPTASVVIVVALRERFERPRRGR
jgi:hypothetical protein